MPEKLAQGPVSSNMSHGDSKGIVYGDLFMLTYICQYITRKIIYMGQNQEQLEYVLTSNCHNVSPLQFNVPWLYFG